MESRITAQRIKTRPQEDAGVETLFIALLQPRHRLIVVAERRIDDGNLRGIRVGPRALLQIVQKVYRFVSPARYGEGAGEIRGARRAACGQLERFLEFHD